MYSNVLKCSKVLLKLYLKGCDIILVWRVYIDGAVQDCGTSTGSAFGKSSLVLHHCFHISLQRSCLVCKLIGYLICHYLHTNDMTLCFSDYGNLHYLSLTHGAPPPSSFLLSLHSIDHSHIPSYFLISPKLLAIYNPTGCYADLPQNRSGLVRY